MTIIGAALKRYSRELIIFYTFISLLLLAAHSSLGQTNAVPVRITLPVDRTRLVAIPGNRHILASPQFYRGAAPQDLPMNRMLLVLKRSQEQDAALQTLLSQLHDGSSPIYHQWLTPAQFGARFGPADQDIRTVVSWLISEGFHDVHVSLGRTSIEFSGNAMQVESAFNTAIHRFVVRGEQHWANVSDPQIPEALSLVVGGVETLNNFFPKPSVVLSPQRMQARVSPANSGHPLFTSGSTHALAPADLATIYDIAPLYSAHIDGSGTTIALVGDSNIDVSNVEDFRRVFGLPPNAPKITVNGPDPGTIGGSEVEAILDTEWAGALAPRATIELVVSADTNATFGFQLSEQYIVDNNLGNVMSESFGICEPYYTASQVAGLLARAEQAAAQGMTTVISAGDSGSAACDQTYAALFVGTSVQAPASSPFATAVGGSQFSEGPTPSRYWANQNAADGASALSYIPETVWNESVDGRISAEAVAGGGGASTLFAKPAWQSGVVGIPNDGRRDLPDVSLSAASNHDPYLLCLYGSCSANPQGTVDFYGVGGTSAGAPSFAAIMALVNQKTGSRQGVANTVLYRLAAAEDFSQCNGSSDTSLPAAVCVFNDITTGSNAVPGEVGYGSTSSKYMAGTGYDLATGLGSVNAANLVNGWESIGFSPSLTTLVVLPANIHHGDPVNFVVRVASRVQNATPTGLVSLLLTTGQSLGSFPLVNGQASGTTTAAPFGTYGIIAHYAGDLTFAPSDSEPAPLSVFFNPSPTVTTEQVLTLDNAGNLVPLVSVPYGSYVYLAAAVTSLKAGVPTGAVNFIDSGSSVGGHPYPLNASGTTSTPDGLYDLGAGSHSLVAKYTGDVNFQNSMSSPAVFTVTKGITNATLNSNVARTGPNTPVTLTFEVGYSGAGLPPSGTVSFSTDTQQLGSVALGSYRAASVVLEGIFSIGTAELHVDTTFTTNALPLGSDSIVATYSGDADYAPSSATAHVLIQASNFTQDFGTLGVNTGSSTTLTLNYELTSEFGTPTFATRLNQDYTVGTAVCTPAGYVQECSVPVVFRPQAPGLRQDALVVQVQNSSTQVLAITSLNGMGDAPLAAVAPGSVSVVAGGGNNQDPGGYGDGGLATSASLNSPGAMAVDAAGNIFICDTGHNRIRRVDHETGLITSVGGSPASFPSGDGGPATQAAIVAPSSIAIDAAGNLYIGSQSDTNVRRIDAVTGLISTIRPVSLTSQPSSAIPVIAFTVSDSVTGLAIDRFDHLFVAGEFSQVKKIDLSTGLETIAAGTGNYGSTGDGGLATQAELEVPGSLATDAAGNLFIADRAAEVIRKVDAGSGVISTVVRGLPGATAGLALDPAGDLYLLCCNANPNAISLQKLGAYGVLSTIGDAITLGGVFINPAGLALDASGNLYASDAVFNVIHRISASSATVVQAAGIPATVSNIGTEQLSITGISTGGSFTNLACVSGIALTPGRSCVFPAPPNAGLETVTDNSLNQPATQQLTFRTTFP